MFLLLLFKYQDTSAGDIAIVSAKNFESGNLNVLDLNYLFELNDQIWKTQQWPQDWERSVFIPVLKKGSAKGSAQTTTQLHSSHMLEK